VSEPAGPFGPDGTPSSDLVALILVGRERGYLTPDDLLLVMGDVELTPELLSRAIRARRGRPLEGRPPRR
jgi:hypothetical protein